MSIMLLALLFSAILFQANSQPGVKPVVDNDRVTVWDVNPEGAQIPGARPLDAVVISFTGKAIFVPRGASAHIGGRTIVINLKDHPVPPIANTSGYPLAYPRPGATKLLENDRVAVWDYVWMPNVPTPMHFHDKDVVVLFLENGDLKSTTPDGKEVVTSYTTGTIRFNQGNRAHFETLIRGKQHAIVTELK